MERTDEELIVAYRAGEQGAFELLTGRHLNGVYTFILRLVGSAEEAEDIAQDTFLKAWRSLSSYEPQESRFKTWLMRIARNSAIDFLRRKKHIPFSQFDTEKENTMEESIPDQEELPDERFARLEDSARVIRALAELREPYREILLLYYTNDLTFEEIGAMLNESPNTSKSRHRRALKALKAILEHPSFGMHPKERP